MKSTCEEPIEAILSEKSDNTLLSRIKNLSEKGWLQLIHSDTAIDSLIKRIPADTLQLHSFIPLLGSCLAYRLADRSFTSSEDFIRIVKNNIYPVLFSPFEDSFMFFARLREVFQSDLDFTLEVCGYIALNNETLTYANLYGARPYFEHINLRNFQHIRIWGDSAATFALADMIGPAFEIGLKVCVESDENHLFEILKKCPLSADGHFSMYMIKWALMFGHHQVVTRYLDFLKEVNIDYLNHLLKFDYDPEPDPSYQHRMKVKWRRGIPEKEFSTGNSLYMMALLHEADNVIDWIHNLISSDNTLTLDYFTRFNISLDIMHTPAIAKQCFSAEMHLLNNILIRYSKAETSGSYLDQAKHIGPDNETLLYVYSKNALQARSRSLFTMFIQRFVMFMLFDVEGSFNIFRDQCRAYILTLRYVIAHSDPEDEDISFVLLYGIDETFSYFFKIKDSAFLSLFRYKELLKMVHKTLSSFEGILAQSTGCEYLYSLNWLNETLMDPDSSRAESPGGTTKAMLAHYESSINTCMKVSDTPKPVFLQRAIIWIIKADSFVFTDSTGEVIEDVFAVKEGIYKHLSTLITDADLLANMKQSLFDMYMYLASSSQHPLSAVYYEIAHRHLQDIGKYLTIAKYSSGFFDQGIQEQQLTESCMQFIQKTSGLSLIDVESYAKPLKLSLGKLKKLLLQEQLSYGGFYKFMSDMINQNDLQQEPKQSSSLSSESLFSQEPENPSKKLKVAHDF